MITKQAPNFFIGCFNKQSNILSKVSFTTNIHEAMNQFFRNNNKFIEHYEQTLYKIYSKIEVDNDCNRIPIYNQIIQTEAIELHKLSKLIESKGGLVYYLNTDACLCYFKNIEACEGFDTEYFWDDNKSILKYKFEEKYENKAIINNDNKDNEVLITLEENYKNRVVNDEIRQLAAKRYKLILKTKKSRINAINYKIKDASLYSSNEIENYNDIIRNVIKIQRYVIIDGKYYPEDDERDINSIKYVLDENNNYIEHNSDKLYHIITYTDKELS
jgi:hypothetical protein